MTFIPAQRTRHKATWVMAALLCAGALAGCTDGGPTKAAVDDEPSDGNGDPGGNPAGSAENAGSSGPAHGASGHSENLPPAPMLNATILNGTVPFPVHFTLFGSDPNGDSLNWSLDVENDGVPEYDGTTLPFHVNHTFDVVGIYNVSFALTDGALSATSNLTINATVPTGIQATVTFTGTLTGSSDVAPNANTHGFILTKSPPNKMIVHVTWGTAGVGNGAGLGDINVALRTPLGDSAGDGQNLNIPGGSTVSELYPPANFIANDERFEVTDRQSLDQVGSWTLRVDGYITVQTTYIATITFE